MANENQDFDLFRDLKTFVGGGLVIFSIFSRTVEVFFHREIGQRYLRFEVILLNFMILNIASLLMGTENPITGMVTISSGLKYFSYAFLIAGIFHKTMSIKRNFNADYSIHSMSFGKPWGIWTMIFKEDGVLNKMFPDFIYRVAEPAFVFLVGSIVSGFDAALGSYLMFASVCLFFSMWTYYRMRITRFLDENDARLESGEDNNAHFGKIYPKAAAGGGQPVKAVKQEWS